MGTIMTNSATWTALNGQLVFDICLAGQADATNLSIVRIRAGSKGGESEEYHVLDGQDCRVKCRFQSGFFVHGYFRQQIIRVGGDQIGLYADIHLGHGDDKVEQHYEGVMALLPLDNMQSLPDPEPIMPPLPTSVVLHKA